MLVAAVVTVAGDAGCEQQQNPCLNGGQCVPLIGDYYCDCPSNTTGRNCERSTFVLYCHRPTDTQICCYTNPV